MIGLATRAIAAEDLGGTTAELAERLAAQPLLAVRGAKHALNATWYEPKESLRLELKGLLRCLGSDDFDKAHQAAADGPAPQRQRRRR